ncbi:uroporphyrinogen-III C-methyltransferase [Desulfovibrio legallii]|uniref:uroporphyrinogen-III C-methyltransferase n=1 Tax=Desulfovibrio legallii TaxID=571438 RepID=A0A1G7NNY5_9BACT|nr:uroporphyrinogen-III C-methyltransferase [Desulfovibrio legallii]SDF75661.1 uroporphyrinogen-III synthase /uroporphyrinogen-III C-methyltransferase [Desulfovibrio legallii]
MKVYLIGAGPGDAGLLTLKGRDALAGADVVVYDALANEALLAHARPDAEKIYVGKVAGNHALPQEQINALLVGKAREGKVVARLKGGDPYIFGRGGEEAEELAAAGVPFEEVPGISSTVAAPAYAGIPLTHRDFASSVTIITGHENPDKPGSVHNWSALAASAATLVFVMGMKNLPDIVRNLLAAGMNPQTPAALVYRGTTPAQRSLAAPLADLPQAAAAARFTNPSVIVVGKVAGLRGTLNWFENRPLFGRRIVVTRAREQASGLARSLTDLGAEVIQCPTIEIRPLEDYAALDAALARLAEYQWIIFTSVNGVRCFWQRLEAAGKDSRALGGCRVAAIGPATAQALRGHGIAPDFVPERYVAEGVLEGLLAREGGQVAGKRFLLPRAAKAREVLPEELRKAGAVVDVLPAYAAVPAAHNQETVLRCLEEGRLDCVTFGSSSTVENFLALIPAATLKAHPETQLAAIGPVTAQTLAAHGLPCHIQPAEYTIPALVAALQTHFARSARA